MDNTEQYRQPQLEEEEEQEIDWVGLAAKLWSYRKFIIIVTCIFAILGVGVALLSKKKYTVNLTLAPEIQGANKAGGLSSITSMLGLGGAMTGTSSDALNITLFPEICSSTPFLTNLFDVKVTPYVSKKELREGAAPARPTTLYKYITKEDEEKSAIALFLGSLFGTEEEEDDQQLNPSQLTSMQHNVVELLSKSITADVDKKTGVTTISVTMDDPLIATQLADTVCQRLQNYVIDYRTKKATEDYEYYTKLADEAKEKLVKAQAAYALSVDYDRSVILQSVNSEKQRLQEEASLANQIYTQMEQQKEMAKAKIQELKPVFAVVQPATMPLRPSSTSRKIIVLGFIFIGFCLAAGWKLFGQEFMNSFRTSLDEKMREQKVLEAQEQEYQENKRAEAQLRQK